MSSLAGINKEENKLKSTVLSIVEAKGSTWNMLVTLGLCWRQHSHFLTFALFLKTIFEN
jgi:hypothetical protein